MKFNKKGQAAMEFLMTYGWAILVVLIAIGALAYFGVLNPSRFLPSSCTLTPGLGCTDFNANSTQVNMEIRNGIGNRVVFQSLDVVPADPLINCTALDGTSPTYLFNITDGNAALAEVSCTGLTSGDRLKADIVATYTTGSSTLSKSFTGSIVTEIQ